MSKAQLKKLLNSMDKNDIASLILELYDAKKEAKEYLEYYLNPNEKEKFEKYKQIIEEEYSLTSLKCNARLSVAKKAISDFSKFKPSVELQADLMLFLVESGCEFTYVYGDMDEGFYIGMFNNFERVLKFMSKNNLLEKFRPRAEQCVKWASACGYGFADTMESVFEHYYFR